MYIQRDHGIVKERRIFSFYSSRYYLNNDMMFCEEEFAIDNA